MHSFDTGILLFLNQYSQKSQVLDHLVVYLQDASLLKAAGFIAVLWWFWFDPRDTGRHRASILATLTATAAAILLARGLAHVLPFRARPMNVEALHFALPLGMKPGSLEDWSSFPSDHATMFFALATGIFFLSRRLGVLSFIWVLIVVILPRLYIGIHFPTDIVAGTVLGIFIAWLANRDFIRNPLARIGAAWLEKHPASFYVCFFLASYQFVVLFDDLRDLAEIVKHAIRVSRTGADWDAD
jgi:undecaprenyl-diphosphatase